MFSQNTSGVCFCVALPNMNELKVIPHRFLLLFAEELLCGAFPFGVIFPSYLSDYNHLQDV